MSIKDNYYKDQVMIIGGRSTTTSQGINWIVNGVEFNSTQEFLIVLHILVQLPFVLSWQCLLSSWYNSYRSNRLNIEMFQGELNGEGFN